MRLTHKAREESPALVHSLCWVEKGYNGEKTEFMMLQWAVITKQSMVLLAPHGGSCLWPAGLEQKKLVSSSLSVCPQTPRLTSLPQPALCFKTLQLLFSVGWTEIPASTGSGKPSLCFPPKSITYGFQLEWGMGETSCCPGESNFYFLRQP